MRVMEKLRRKRGRLGAWPWAASHRLYRHAAEHLCRRHDSLVTGALGLRKLSTAVDQDIMGGVCPLHLGLSVIVSTVAFLLSLYTLVTALIFRYLCHHLCSPCSLSLPALLLALRLTASSTRVDTINTCEGRHCLTCQLPLRGDCNCVSI